MGGVPSLDRSKEEKVAVQAQLGSFELNTFSTQKSYSQNKPKQLSAMLLKQEVLV